MHVNLSTASFIPSIPTTSAPSDSNSSQFLHAPVRSSNHVSASNAQPSPVHSPPFLSLPSSPAMDGMVSGAVSQVVGDDSPSRKRLGPNTTASPRPRSRASQDSSTSAQDVEYQLTQSDDPDPYPSSSPAMNSIELENGPVNGQETAFASQLSNTNFSPHHESPHSWHERNSSLFDSTTASHPQGRPRGVTLQAGGSQTLDDSAFHAQSLQLQTQAPYFSQSSTDESQ